MTETVNEEATLDYLMYLARHRVVVEANHEGKGIPVAIYLEGWTNQIRCGLAELKRLWNGDKVNGSD